LTGSSTLVCEGERERREEGEKKRDERGWFFSRVLSTSSTQPLSPFRPLSFRHRPTYLDLLFNPANLRFRLVEGVDQHVELGIDVRLWRKKGEREEWRV
jgi:hypothetical protein